MSTLDLTGDLPGQRPGRPTYGGFSRMATPGLFGLGSIGTAVIFVLFMVVFGTLNIVGLAAALAVAAAGALMLATLLVKDPDQRNLLIRFTEWAGGVFSRRTKSNIYRSGPLSPHPWGTHGLPGLLADTTLYEIVDSYARACAMLRWNATGDFTIVLMAEPEGQVLVDEDQVDQWVANFGGWLAALADEPGLLGASVIIETTEDTGARLRTRVAAKADPKRGHPVALAMLRESAETFPVGTPQVTAWITLTYEAPGDKDPAAALAGKDPVVRASDTFGARIAALAAGLAETGAGQVRPVAASELCEEMLLCFDPAKQPAVDAAHAGGQALELDWEDIGPVSAKARRRDYLHDSGASITWEMTVPPRGVHYSNILTNLLAPQAGVRKRVALHYQLIPAWKAAKIVDGDVRTAEFRVSQSKKPSARAITELKAAHSTADAEAHGAALLNVAMSVTATVTDGINGDGEPVTAIAQLPVAATAIDNVAPTARVRLRRVTDAQDSAFVTTCPVGAVMPRHLRTPAGLREAM